MNAIKLVWNKGTGADIALVIPTKMGGDSLQKWIYANRKLIRDGKKRMRKEQLDDLVLYTMPDISYTPKLGEFSPPEVTLFEKRIDLEVQAGNKLIYFHDGPDHNHEWNSGFVEYLIDRYEYGTVAGNVFVHLNKPK